MTEVDRREIRVRRAQMMLTQEELAERAGVAARTVRDIETGRTKHPRPSTVRLLLDALTVAERESNDSAVPGIRPRELPMDTFGFTGREEHLAELDRHHGAAVPAAGVHPGRDIDLHALAALADVDLSQARRETSLLTRAHLVEEIARNRFGMHDLLRVLTGSCECSRTPALAMVTVMSSWCHHECGRITGGIRSGSRNLVSP